VVGRERGREGIGHRPMHGPHYPPAGRHGCGFAARTEAALQKKEPAKRTTQGGGWRAPTTGRAEGRFGGGLPPLAGSSDTWQRSPTEGEGVWGVWGWAQWPAGRAWAERQSTIGDQKEENEPLWGMDVTDGGIGDRSTLGPCLWSRPGVWAGRGEQTGGKEQYKGKGGGGICPLHSGRGYGRVSQVPAWSQPAGVV